MQRNKEIQVCKFRKPEADTITNDKAVNKNRGIHMLLNRSITMEIKGLPVYKGTNGM